MAMEVVTPTLPVESMTVDGTAPPELVGVAVGDMAVLLVRTKPIWIVRDIRCLIVHGNIHRCRRRASAVVRPDRERLERHQGGRRSQIVPLLVPKERPLGSAGEIAHEVIVYPNRSMSR